MSHAVCVGLAVCFGIGAGLVLVGAIAVAMHDVPDHSYEKPGHSPVKWWLLAACPVLAGLSATFGALA